MKAVTGSVASVRPRVATLRQAIAEALSGASSERAARARGGDLAIFAASGAAILSAVLAVAATAPASAQQQPQADSLEEITVTGSRIRRQDFTANAPITTVDESAFTDTGTIGVETILNQLPQFVPAITQFNSAGQVDSNAVSTVGASTVSLRGLGPNRNLVLVDDHRRIDRTRSRLPPSSASRSSPAERPPCTVRTPSAGSSISF